MNKIIHIRLPNWAGEEIERIAERKGLAFATTAKELICEKLRELEESRSMKSILGE
jgi:predicted DNA-binding protein